MVQIKLTENEAAPAVFMTHGMMSNGMMFYSKTGKGLAPFLARAGFNVFIGDMRGRGDSTPRISENSDHLNKHGFSETACEDVPAFYEEVKRISGQQSQSWIAHSMGGLWMSMTLARFPDIARNIDSQIYFATKRTICGDFSFRHFFNIKFGWNLLAVAMAKHYGYLPAKKIKFGSDDETIQCLMDSIEVLKCGSPWILSSDGFDYGKATKALIDKGLVPPTMHLFGKNDLVLGRLRDVTSFAQETSSNPTICQLSKDNNNAENYDHVSILLSKNAERDHFPKIVDWLNKNNNRTVKQTTS